MEEHRQQTQVFVLCNSVLTQTCPASLFISGPQDTSKHPKTHWEGGRQKLELLQLLWNSLCFNHRLLTVIFSPEHNVIWNPFVLLWQLMPVAVSCQGALYPHWGFACKVVLITSGKQDILCTLTSRKDDSFHDGSKPHLQMHYLDKKVTSPVISAGWLNSSWQLENKVWQPRQKPHTDAKELLNYSLHHINKFPELLGGSYPSCFTSNSIYSAIRSSADSGSGKLSTLLFQPGKSLWGSNCLCSVMAFCKDALHQRELLSEFR